MNDQISSFAPSPEATAALTFPMLLRAAIRGRYVLLACICLSLALGIGVLALMHPLYTATMVVTPKQSNSSVKLSGIASIYASALGNNESPNFTLFEESLGSIRLAQNLQNQDHLLQQLRPGEWDKETKSWRRPSGILAWVKNVLRAVFHLPPWSPPDYRDLAEFLHSNVKVTHGGILSDETEVYDISFTADDPSVAFSVLSKVYWGAESIVREQQRYDLGQMISHLQDMVSKETSQEVRVELVNQLIGNRTQLALLQNDTPVATLIVDPPVIPKVQSFPNPKLTLLFSGLLGAFVGLAFGIMYGLFGWKLAAGSVQNALSDYAFGFRQRFQSRSPRPR